MAFFENLSKKVQDVAFVAAEKGKEVAAVASEKAQSAAESVKISAAIASEQRTMDRNYRAIGEWYVSEAGDELPAAIADIVRAVHESKAKIADLEAQRSAKDGAGAGVDVSAESEADIFCDDPADAKVGEPCESTAGE